jgi:hypothetical protein
MMNIQVDHLVKDKATWDAMSTKERAIVYWVMGIIDHLPVNQWPKAMCGINS